MGFLFYTNMTDNNSNYKLSRAWFDFAFENPDRCNPNHTALYMWILEKKNRLGHKEKFGLPTCEAMEVLGIKSKHTYYKAFNDLVDFGFIKVITESHNQYTSIVIMLCQKLSQHKHSTNTALDLALIQHAHSTVPIVKPTNQQTPKQINNIPPTKEEEELAVIFPFDTENFKSAWKNWLKYRSEKRKPLKSILEQQSALKKLSQFDEEFAIGLIETSMGNGWTGLVFEKTKEQYEQYKNSRTKIGKTIDDIIRMRYQ